MLIESVKEKDNEQGALLEKYQTDNRELRGEITSLKEKMQSEYNKYILVKSRFEDTMKKENPEYNVNEDPLMGSFAQDIKVNPSLVIEGINKIKNSLKTILNIHGQNAMTLSINEVTKEDMDKITSFIDSCISSLIEKENETRKGELNLHQKLIKSVVLEKEIQVLHQKFNVINGPQWKQWQQFQAAQAAQAQNAQRPNMPPQQNIPQRQGMNQMNNKNMNMVNNIMNIRSGMNTPSGGGVYNGQRPINQQNQPISQPSQLQQQMMMLQGNPKIRTQTHSNAPSRQELAEGYNKQFASMGNSYNNRLSQSMVNLESHNNYKQVQGLYNNRN